MVKNAMKSHSNIKKKTHILYIGKIETQQLTAPDWAVYELT